MIECKLCHKMFLTLNTHIERTHKTKINDYKIRFGQDAPLYSDETKKAQSKNATSPFMVRHWTKKGFSEAEAIELAKPYLKNNADNAKIYSPRCIEHWVKKGFSQEDAKVKVSDYQRRGLKFYTDLLGEKDGEIKFKAVIKSLTYANSSDGLREKGFSDDDIRKYKDHRSLAHFEDKYGKIEGEELYKISIKEHRKYSFRCIEYWMRLGYSEEESKKKVSVIQVRNLETFILKYGEVDGLIKYKAWTISSQTGRTGGISKESIVYFQELKTFCDKNFISYISEYRIGRENGRNYYYDLCLPELKIIFEYDGAAFHADPLNEDLNWIGRHGLTYAESLNNDIKKQTHAEIQGFTIVRIHSTRKKYIKIIDIVKERINESRI